MTPEDRDNTGLSGEEPESEPVRALAEQELQAPPDFVQRVRRRIYRRASTSQLVSFSWSLPKVVLLEMVSLLGHLFTSMGGRKDVRS